MSPSVHFSSEDHTWATPPEVFDPLDEEFNFTLDPCASEHNHKCDKYYTFEDNGLLKSWANEVVFCNPPYGRVIGEWVQKCYNESLNGATCVMLIPSRTDTKWWHDYVMKGEVRFIKGRIRFVGARNSAPFPSAIVVFKGLRHPCFQ